MSSYMLDTNIKHNVILHVGHKYKAQCHHTCWTQISSYISEDLFYCVQKSIIWITQIKSAILNAQIADKEIPIFTKLLLTVIIVYVDTNFIENFELPFQ